MHVWVLLSVGVCMSVFCKLWVCVCVGIVRCGCVWVCVCLGFVMRVCVCVCVCGFCKVWCVYVWVF